MDKNVCEHLTVARSIDRWMRRRPHALCFTHWQHVDPGPGRGRELDLPRGRLAQGKKRQDGWMGGAPYTTFPFLCLTQAYVADDEDAGKAGPHGLGGGGAAEPLRMRGHHARLHGAYRRRPAEHRGDLGLACLPARLLACLLAGRVLDMVMDAKSSICPA